MAVKRYEMQESKYGDWVDACDYDNLKDDYDCSEKCIAKLESELVDIKRQVLDWVADKRDWDLVNTYQNALDELENIVK